MANRTSTLKLVIAGENKGAIGAVKGTEKAVGGLQGKLGGLAAGIGGAALVAGVERLTQAAVDGYTRTASSVALVNRLTGVGAENASLLAFAAQQSGVDATKAAASWGIFATNIKNGKVAAQGIATTDGNGKLRSFGDILDDTADKLASLPAGFQRTAAARALFGRGGADMVKILARGSEGIEDLRDKMKALGLEFDDAGLKKYQKFLQSQRDLQASLSGLEVKVGSALVPALGKAADAVGTVVEKFQELPGPVQAVVGGVGGLGLAFAGLAGAVGLVWPVLQTGAGILGGLVPTLGGAAVATDALAVSEVTAAEAQGILTAAWIAGTPAVEAAVVSREALAVADVEMAAAEGEAAAAGIGLTAALGPVAIAGAAVAAALMLAGRGSAKFSVDTQKALGATDAQLVQLAKDAAVVSKINGKNAFADITDVRVLLAMRDALKGQGIVLPDLNKAIRDNEAATARANKRTKEAATANDGAANSQEHYKKKLEESTAALEKHNTAGQATFDAQQGLATANDDVKSSLTDMATALADANGTSDEAVAASQAITDAQKDEASARRDVVDLQVAATEAQRDLNRERVDAVKRLDDLAEATRKAAQSERDATLALHEAQNENRRTLANERSTPIERERAAVALLDAQDNANSATRDHAKAIEDENTAKAKGVEGDDQVVAAKKKVADAQQAIVDGEGKVNEAHRKVSEAVRARSKFEEAAILKVRDAHEKVNTALLNRVEANARVVESQYGVVAGDLALRDGLKELSDLLAPGSTLSNNTIAWAESVAAALRGFDSRRGSTGEVTGITRPQSFGETPATVTTSTPPPRDPDKGPRTVIQHITVNGEPTTKQKRQAKALAREGLGEVVRAAG